MWAQWVLEGLVFAFALIGGLKVYDFLAGPIGGEPGPDPLEAKILRELEDPDEAFPEYHCVYCALGWASAPNSMERELRGGERPPGWVPCQTHLRNHIDPDVEAPEYRPRVHRTRSA